MSEALVTPPAWPMRPPMSRWRLLLEFPRNNVSVYGDNAFEAPFLRGPRIFGVQSVVLNDPADARWMLGAGAANYRRPEASLRILRPIAGAGVLTSEGDAWRRQRRMLAPAFTPGSVELMLPHFRLAAEGLLDRLKRKRRANLAEAFQETALDAVLRALFSLPNPREREAVARLARQYLRGPGRPMLLDGFAKREADFGWTQASRHRFGRVWRSVVNGLIEQRRRQPGGAHSDLLDLLLAARDPDTGEGLPDAEICDQCGTMLFAGHETTARLLFWASYLLTLAPDEQDRLRAEARAFAPEDTRSLTDFDKRPRTRLVLYEALRLYPPAPNVVREAIADHEISGEPIRRGDLAWVVPFVLHRHRRFWSDPTAFRPDRFAGQASPWANSAYLPFGAGPRSCIGAAFVLAEAQVVLPALLSRLRIALMGDRPVLPVGRITLAPDHEPWFRLSPA